MKTQILHIEPYDDNHSVIDKMDWGKSDRILIVFPRTHQIITRKLDIVLLQRHAVTIGAEIAFVSKNIQINEFAFELDIPVFKSLRQARRLTWESITSPDPKTFKYKTRDTSLEDLRKNALPSGKNPKMFRRGPRLIFFTIGVLAFMVVLLTLIPSAEIRLNPETSEQEIILDLSADPNTTSFSPAGILPALALSITVEGRDSVQPTGSINVPELAAIGEIQFTNLTDQEILIPIGTIVRTNENNPIRFVTQSEIILPAISGAKASTTIQATNPGTASNLPEESLIIVDGDLGLRISAINNEPTTEGSELESRAPTQSDYDRLFNELEEALFKSAIQEAATQINENDLLIIAGPKSYEVLEEIFSPPNPQPVTELSLQLQIEYQILYIAAETLEAVGIINLDATLLDGYLANNESIFVEALTVPEFDGEAQVYWQAKVQRTIYPEINSDEVRHLVKGETVETALKLIGEHFVLVSDPQINLNPEWWPILPFIPIRITIISD